MKKLSIKCVLKPLLESTLKEENEKESLKQIYRQIVEIEEGFYDNDETWFADSEKKLKEKHQEFLLEKRSFYEEVEKKTYQIALKTGEAIKKLLTTKFQNQEEADQFVKAWYKEKIRQINERKKYIIKSEDGVHPSLEQSNAIDNSFIRGLGNGLFS